MADGTAFERLFQLIQDPALILDEAGRIERVNPAARALFGRDPSGGNLLDFVAGEREAARRYLHRCAGTTRPLPGAVMLATAEEKRNWQSHGARLSPDASGPVRILMTCRRHGVQEFSVLGQKLRELNDEMRYRRRVQAELEEALAEKETLLLELQHRLKNHTQMLLAMVRSAQRDAGATELRDFADVILARLHAIGTAQSFMYGIEEWRFVPGGRFIQALCNALASGWPSGAVLDVTAENVEIENNHAVPLALIVNELTTNALRHGLAGGAGHVAVALRRADGEIVLTVRDSGANWNGPSSHTAESGLALVKGLCRQIGAVLEIGTGGGTCCTVRWPGNGEAAPR
jgi:two-component sensor histidine kinase